MSHKASETEGRPGDNEWKKAHAYVIERITGRAPETCPWRAYYDPLVKDVLEVWWAVEAGNLQAAIGQDPPAILVDAIGEFARALEATRADDAKLRREKLEAERRK